MSAHDLSHAAQKKEWTTPQLQTHGSLEKITGLIFKQFGARDGLTFQGTPIGNLSS